MPPTNPPAMAYITLGDEPTGASPVRVNGPPIEWVDGVGKQVWPVTESSPEEWTVYFWRGAGAGSWWAVGPYQQRRYARAARQRYLKLPDGVLHGWSV
jgi:hypothetical protein